MRRPEDLYRSQAREVVSAQAAVIPLYDRLVQSCLLARQAMERRDLTTVDRQLIAAQEVLLLMAQGAEADRTFEGSQNLSSLFMFCREELRKANMEKDPALLEAPLKVLEELRGAFVQADKTGRVAQ